MEKNMNTGEACAIFKKISTVSDEYTDAEIIDAIRIVIDMETHNSITKYDMLKALNWLWEFAYRCYKR